MAPEAGPAVSAASTGGIDRERDRPTTDVPVSKKDRPPGSPHPRRPRPPNHPITGPVPAHRRRPRRLPQEPVVYLAKKFFWAGTLERAVKTFLQVLVAGLIIGTAVGTIGVDLRNLDWKTALWLALGATVLSVLSSIASGPIGPTNSPSLVRESATPVTQTSTQ